MREPRYDQRPRLDSHEDKHRKFYLTIKTEKGSQVEMQMEGVSAHLIEKAYQDVPSMVKLVRKTELKRLPDNNEEYPERGREA